MSKPIISVQNLQKSFKKIDVLKGVSFEIQQGNIFALLGSNGAGKTTCVRILSTLLAANGGTASVCGYDIDREPNAVRASISLTGQFAAVDEVLTGRDNLTIIGKLKRIADVKHKASEWLDAFDLTEAADRAVSEYSGGMRRKLDIAMSLMGAPAVIFLDEPTTGLDPQNRLAMWKLVKNLANDGTTVFLTTQYLEEAEQLADRIAILHEGKIIAEGTPGELKAIMPKRGANLEFASESDAEKARQILKDNGISAPEPTQNMPSLEDVFLTLIGEKEEDSHE